jgi:hypothetical protein
MLQLGIRGLGIARFKFNPLSWFAKGEQGAWYDPSDLTTLFQESSGVTPPALEQPVGLMLDKSKGLALGAELVTNGTFDTNITGWNVFGTSTNTWDSANGGRLAINAASVNNGASQNLTGLVIGQTYKLSYSATSGTANPIFAISNSNIAGFYQALGTSVIFTVTATTSTLILAVGASGTCYFDNISVKQIAGNHAFQATNANRPILSSRVNLLTKTEDFSDGVWATINTVTKTPSLAPDGTTTASLIGFTNLAGATLYQLIILPISSGASYTLSLWLKGAVGGETIRIRVDLGSGSTALITKTLSSAWEQVIVPCVSVGTTPSTVYILNNLAGTATSFYIWHPDLRPTNSGALLPPYQRVNTASDYDSAGFPLYLKCNGSSSAMSTNSIDFTATDKMTVVTGVRKLVDQNNAVLVELSAIANSSNPGSFVIHSPLAVSANYATYCVGTGATAQGVVSSLNYLAPISNVLTVLNDIGATTPNEIKLKVNGIFTGTQTGDTGTGNFGNYPLYLFTRFGSPYFLNGQFYGAIIRGAQSDTASVTQTEQYMAQKTGITF